MDAHDVMWILYKIDGTSSRNEKEDILARHLNDPFFKEVMNAAMTEQAS